MKQKISTLLLSCLFATCAFSASQRTFQMGPASDYDLPPNDPLVFSNMFMWPVKATCTIKSNEKNNTVSFAVLRKTGSVNNLNLSSGQSTTLILHPNDVVYIEASSGAKVELLNHGSKTISASCSAL